MKYKFCLHIGMHKTGSSFLQKNVFPYFRRMKFWHQPNFNIVRGSKPTSFSRFMASSPLIWRDLGKQLFDKIKKTDTDVLVSDEHTTLVNDPYRISQHVSEMRRILEPYHELRVLVVIRRQDTWFASAYAETTSEYKEVSQNHFRRWVEDRITPEKKCFSSAGVRVEYHTLIQKLQKVLKNNLLVLPFEMLKKDPTSFVEKCCDYAGRRVPQSISLKPKNKKSLSEKKWRVSSYSRRHIQLRPSRLFHAVLGRSRIRIPVWGREKEITLTEDLSKLILKRYKTENEKLDRHLNLGLKQYGYY